MRTLLQMLRDDPAFQLALIVTGMHLMKQYGSTIDEIKKDGYHIEATVDMKLSETTNTGMAKSLGYALIGITDALTRSKPDLVLLVGDRGEMLAAAIAAAHLNIPIAHISGGDTTTGATVDELIRHAITKFADIHFPANENSAENIIKLGENPRYVFPVGNPGIPVKYHVDEKRKQQIIKNFHLDIKKPILLVLQHPVTTQVDQAASQMRETMEAIKDLGMQTIVLYPNSDAGSKDMIHVIHEYEHIKFIQIYKNIHHDDFQDLMMLCDVIIGNSSCGLLEAPSFNLPAVNIGERQKGRGHTFNIINSDHNKDMIVKAVQHALTKEIKEKVKTLISPYAKKNAEENIIKILKEINYHESLKAKFCEKN